MKDFNKKYNFIEIYSDFKQSNSNNNNNTNLNQLKAKHPQLSAFSLAIFLLLITIDNNFNNLCILPANRSKL